MEFQPNVTPQKMFQQGSFGGTYWRPIYSSVTRKKYKNIHKKYSFLANVSEEFLSSTKYDHKKNKYSVKVGSTLEEWENNNWIHELHPYGWVHWYCDYYAGKRSEDDTRQIDRWNRLAGPNGRFRKHLITQILKKNGKYDDYSISPRIRQTLLHWGYELTKNDFDQEKKKRNLQT
jgi:hypothetical protein